MKMKGARIEFVPFDAQDVIATSGKPYFSKDITNYNGDTLESFAGGVFPLDSEDNYWIHTERSGMDPISNFYTLNSADWYFDISTYYVLDVTPHTDEPSGNELADYTALLDWLKNHTKDKSPIPFE